MKILEAIFDTSLCLTLSFTQNDGESSPSSKDSLNMADAYVIIYLYAYII